MINVSVTAREEPPARLSKVPFLSDICPGAYWDIVADGEAAFWVAVFPLGEGKFSIGMPTEIGGIFRETVWTSPDSDERAINTLVADFLLVHGYYWKDFWEKEF